MKLEDLEKIIFKPCLMTFPENEEHLAVIYNVHSSESLYPNLFGERSYTQTQGVSIADITETLKNNKVQIQDVELEKTDDLSQIFKEINKDDYKEEINKFLEIAASEYSELTTQMFEVNNIISCLAPADKSVLSNAGGIDHVIGEEDDENIVGLKVKSIFGDNTPLNEDDLQYVVPTVVRTISENSDIDPNDDNQIEELKRKIEVDVIDVLPNAVEVQDLEINKEKIAEIIKNQDDDLEGA